MSPALRESWLMRTLSPQAQPQTEERKTGRVPPGDQRKMGMERLRAGGQARIVGMEAARWVPVTIATQVSPPKIDANGVQCSLPGASCRMQARSSLPAFCGLVSPDSNPGSMTGLCPQSGPGLLKAPITIRSLPFSC